MTTLKDIAQMMHETQRIHEESYVPGTGEFSIGHYGKSIQQAAEEACSDANDAYLVGCFVFSCWNDAAAWADAELAKESV